jgi:hypothetical protein
MLRQSFVQNRLLTFSVCLEVLGIAAITLLLFFQQSDFVQLGNTVLLISILTQWAISLRSPRLNDSQNQLQLLEQPTANAKLFFLLLFIFGAGISFLDPSKHRLADQIVLDTNFEFHLSYIFPAVLSGATSIWLGIGILVIIIGANRIMLKLSGSKDLVWSVYQLIFFSLVAAFTAGLFLTLFYALSWQIDKLHLKSTVWQLFMFLVCRVESYLPGLFSGSSLDYLKPN